MPLSSLAPATRGTNIAEYGLLAALVSVIAIGAILGMGNQVRGSSKTTLGATTHNSVRIFRDMLNSAFSFEG